MDAWMMEFKGFMTNQRANPLNWITANQKIMLSSKCLLTPSERNSHLETAAYSNPSKYSNASMMSRNTPS